MQKVRDSVEVKVSAGPRTLRASQERWAAGEGDRDAAQAAVRLLRKLRAMRKSLPKRDQLLLRIGAARKEAGRGLGFVKIQLPTKDREVTRETFSFQVDKAKLKASEQRDGTIYCAVISPPKIRRCCGQRRACGTHADRVVSFAR